MISSRRPPHPRPRNAPRFPPRAHQRVDILDLVQVVSDHLLPDRGLDEDGQHWVGVAVRESVVNAISGKGNEIGQARPSIRLCQASAQGLAARVRDQGEGFEPETWPTRSPPRTC